ncbi:MAG: GNAT family N-acetyltransferase [Dehalococcoidia bacterium]
MPDNQAPSYPANHTVSGEAVTLRLMTREDRDAFLAFSRHLDHHDLMFLQRDITNAADVEKWIESVEAGLTTTILAFAGDRIVGYAAVQRSALPWTEHVAELRVLLAKEMRGKGLGRILTGDAFAIAVSQGIEKMMAQMTLDQRGAIAVFEGIGFRPEALLRDHVKDREGERHDLLVLSHEVARYSEPAH